MNEWKHEGQYIKIPSSACLTINGDVEEIVSFEVPFVKNPRMLPVFVKRNKAGLISAIKIQFIEEHENS